MCSWLCPRSSPTNKILPHTAHRKGLVRSQRHTRTLGLKTGNKGKVHCLLQPGHSLLHLALPVTRLRKRPQDPLFVTLGETWVWGGIRRFFTGPFIKDVINQAERVCKQMIYWKTIFFTFIYKSYDEWAGRELQNIKKKNWWRLLWTAPIHSWVDPSVFASSRQILLLLKIAKLIFVATEVSCGPSLKFTSHKILRSIRFLSHNHTWARVLCVFLWVGWKITRKFKIINTVFCDKSSIWYVVHFCTAFGQA